MQINQSIKQNLPLKAVNNAYYPTQGVHTTTALLLVDPSATNESTFYQKKKKKQMNQQQRSCDASRSTAVSHIVTAGPLVCLPLHSGPYFLFELA